MSALFGHTGQAYTVGITGAPGAGKSTLTDALIGRIRRDGAEVGVLAIDPTSPFSGGAILGDRVRMQDHATDPGVFIRSMATRGHLGGLALATPQAQRVLDAAALPWILVETVGVGQVEVEIAGAADTTVVVVNPGWGDGVQANKAGLLEIADVFVVNKADRPGVAETVRDLELMLELSAGSAWRPPIIGTVATRHALSAVCSGVQEPPALMHVVHASNVGRHDCARSSGRSSWLGSRRRSRTGAAATRSRRWCDGSRRVSSIRIPPPTSSWARSRPGSRSPTTAASRRRRRAPPTRPSPADPCRSTRR